MKPIFKSKYYKIYNFTKGKTLTISYKKIKDIGVDFLINSDHVFRSNGFQTIILTDNSAETINPLDFQSKYSADDFKSAIKSKIVKDAFNTLKSGKLDIMKVLLFVNLGVTFILLYLLLQSNGVF